VKLLNFRVSEITDVMGRTSFNANENQLFKRLSQRMNDLASVLYKHPRCQTVVGLAEWRSFLKQRDELLSKNDPTI
jgi:hypothetical protein